MTPRNAELREIAASCKDLTEAERAQFAAQYACQRLEPGLATALSMMMLDRFYIGQVGMGIAKILTFGGLGVWALVDLFTMRNKVAEMNLEAMRHVKAHVVEMRP